MGIAFEVTDEDIVNVMLDRFDRHIEHDAASELLSSLDLGAVEKAALYGDDLDDQTEAAYVEIERQIRELESAPKP